MGTFNSIPRLNREWAILVNLDKNGATYKEEWEHNSLFYIHKIIAWHRKNTIKIIIRYKEVEGTNNLNIRAYSIQIVGLSEDEIYSSVGTIESMMLIQLANYFNAFNV